MKIVDGCKHTVDGIHPRAREGAGVVQRAVTISHARRALRSCGGRRIHWSMGLPSGASKRPKEAAVHVATAHARTEVKKAVARM
eukprot:410608-Pleurochrysis_carterae.AAC.4